MAIYRSIYTSFWQDAFIVELTPDEKYFYLYLMTNPKTNMCGIYEFSITIASLETGFKKDKVELLLNKFQNEYKKIMYSASTSEVAILNWSKHNESKSPSIKTAISSNLEKVKNKDLINYIHGAYTVDTECTHSGTYTVTVSNTNTSTNSFKDLESKELKKKNFVIPTLDEVKEYCQERNNSIDPETFIAFYDSKGWKIGQNAMKNWKSAIITWEKKDNQDKQKPSPNRNPLKDKTEQKYGIYL